MSISADFCVPRSRRYLRQIVPMIVENETRVLSKIRAGKPHPPRRDQPFTAPTVNPAMKRSTNRLYRKAIGTLAMKQAPISEPQK